MTSRAVDVYALCATLYAVMRGRPPRWDGDRSPSLLSLMDLFHQPIPDLPGVPAGLTQVLRYGMANDPESRPTAQQLREMLTAVQLNPPHQVPAPRWEPGDDTPTIRNPRPPKKKWFGLLGSENR
jgi:hypothetical protein